MKAKLLAVCILLLVSGCSFACIFYGRGGPQKIDFIGVTIKNQESDPNFAELADLAKLWLIKIP